MPRAQQERLVRQFLSSMPLGAQVALFAGIFCCFAPLGLLQSAMRLQVVPWWEIVLSTIFSGSMAMVFTATAIRAPRWIAAPIVLHLLLTAAIVRWLPDRPPVLSLEGPALMAVARRLQLISGLTIASLMGAFVCFFTLIRREGLRFTSAHTEIRLAREIHATLVPAVAGHTTHLEWRGSSKPSGDVGGDLVDVVVHESGWTATVADVSGHGVAAGVLMGMFKTAFRAAATEGRDLGAVVSRINAVITPLRQSNMFITAACLRLTDDHTLHYVCAGHPPMLHLSASTRRAAWVGESQLAIALIDPTHYTGDSITLAPGDVIVVVTDGLLEVFDRHDRELGLEGLQRAVEQTGASATLEDIESAIFEVCRRFGAQTDDQTVLVLRTRTLRIED